MTQDKDLAYTFSLLTAYKFPSHHIVISARLAQSVEHETLNLGVVGSSPTLGEFLFGFVSFVGSDM